MPSLGQLIASSSEFANQRGVYLGRRATKIHVALYRWSGGKIGGYITGWSKAHRPGRPYGRPERQARTSPLMYHPDGDAIVVAASKAGQPTNPA